MKSIAFAAVTLGLTLTFLAGCTGLTPEQRSAVVDVALLEIATLNDAGIDPVNASPEAQALIRSGCAVAAVSKPESFAEIRDVCAVVSEAAK